MKAKKYSVIYDKPIKLWDEALPLGNGKLGCLVYGEKTVRLSLDRNDLWDNTPAKETLEKGFTYKNLVRLVRSGTGEDFKEHNRLFDDIYKNITPTKITAGRIELDFGEDFDNICYRLDIYTAEAAAEIYNQGKVTARINTFCSADKFIGAVKLTGKMPQINLTSPQYLSEEVFESGSAGVSSSIQCLNYKKAEFHKKGNFIRLLQKTNTDFKYGIVALILQNEKGAEVFYTIAAGSSDSIIEDAEKELKSAAEAGYDKLFASHKKWWQRYWAKSQIDIPDKEIEREYYLSYYHFASCSRKGYYPMPLQGVWTADNDRLPPWKGDYHHDLNTQMSYMSYMKANRMEEGRVFCDYLWNLRKTYKNFARKFYGVNGIMIPGVSTIDGMPLGGGRNTRYLPWRQFGALKVSIIIICTAAIWVFLKTGHTRFLKKSPRQ